jgi:hypothetical protein
MVVLNNEPFETGGSDAVLEERAVREDTHDRADLTDVCAYGVVIASRKEDKTAFRDDTKKPFKRSVVVERSGNAWEAKMLPDPPSALRVGETCLDLLIDTQRFDFRERHQLGRQAKFSDRSIDFASLRPHRSPQLCNPTHLEVL